MKFGQAIRRMVEGKTVQRKGWNGKGMFLFIITDWEIITDFDYADDIGDAKDLQPAPFICMKTADNKLIPWSASQADMLAYDWQEFVAG